MLTREIAHAWAAEMGIISHNMRAFLLAEPPMQFLKKVHFGKVRKAAQVMPLSKNPISPKLELQIQMPWACNFKFSTDSECVTHASDGLEHIVFQMLSACRPCCALVYNKLLWDYAVVAVRLYYHWCFTKNIYTCIESTYEYKYIHIYIYNYIYTYT